MQTKSCAWATVTGNSCKKLDSKFGGAILQVHSYTAVPFLGCRLVSCLFHHFFNWHCQNIIHSHLGSHVTCHTYALAESERVLCWGKSISPSIQYTISRQITSHPCGTVDEWHHIELIRYFLMLMSGFTLSTYSLSRIFEVGNVPFGAERPPAGQPDLGLWSLVMLLVNDLNDTACRSNALSRFE